MSNCEPRPGPECARHADAIAALVDEAPSRRTDGGAGRHADAIAPRVDRAPDTPDRRELDAHLAGCEACRSLLADLREIRALAATLVPLEPPARVWRGVERRVAAETEGRTLRGAVRRWLRWPIAAPFGLPGTPGFGRLVRRWLRWPIAAPGQPPSGAGGRRRGWPPGGLLEVGPVAGGAGGRRLRWSLGDATLAGAAVVVVLGVVFSGTRDRLPRTPAGGAHAAATGDPGAPERHYAAAIRDLEQVSNAGVPIPAAARAALTSNLALVDRAIAESRSAVAAAPDNEVARDRLRAGLAHKLTLLRTGAALGLEPR